MHRRCSGLEVAGRIVARGANVTEWNIGDDVCALTPGGGYAEYCATPAAWCLPIPAGWSLEQAAGLPENYFTVWNNVFDRASLSAANGFSCTAARAASDSTAIQLAKAFGATVMTTAGSDDKTAFCRSIGADHAINYRTQDFAEEVKRITDKRGVDVILDMVGGDYIERNLKCLALEGRLSQIAFLQGSRVECDWRLIMLKRLTVTGSTLRASPAARKATLARELRENVWPLLEQRQAQVGDPRDVRARRRGRSARADGIVAAHRQDHARRRPRLAGRSGGRSVGRAAARHVEHRAGRERAVLAREPAHQRRDLVDAAEAARSGSSTA